MGHFIFFSHTKIFKSGIISYFLKFIYSHVHTLGHFSPHPPSLPRRTCSALISNFVERRHKHNKKDKAFLLAELRIAMQRDS
jgi:hypothetical protein